MSESSTLAAGARVGPYVLAEPLGTGASATVYRAFDAEERPFAVKVRRVGVPSLDRRFLREFESMRTLRVPGVVRVYEAGIDDEILWFSMDCVSGRSFLDVVHEAYGVPARVERTIDLGRQLLDILAELHQAGFVHRDVKPSNVLVDSNGRVRVLDFGIARFFGDHDTLSDSGQVLGTVPFMAPEQLSGLPFDHRVDLWATGVMLHEAVNGHRARPQTAVGWIPRICLERLPPLACLYKDVPLGLSQLVASLTAADPDDRPSAQQAAHQLRRLQSGDRGGEWPEPPFVDTGDWWTELEGCIGSLQAAPVQIVQGPMGSGRRRIAEQVHRHGVMQGVWPIHLHCRIDGVGQPLVDALERMLGSSDDPAWHHEVAAEDGEVLRRMWPHLRIAGALGQGPAPQREEAATAAARCLARASARRATCVIVHDLERVDPITSLGLERLAGSAGPRLGVLLIHDPRWESATSRDLVATLQARGAGCRTMPALEPSHALEIAASLCPEAPPGAVAATTPQRAVEAGLEALAAWRGEPWAPPDPSLWPLVVRNSVPEEVFVRVAGRRALESRWVRVEEERVQLRGGLPRRAVGSRLGDVRSAARGLEDAWTRELGAAADPEDIARLRVLAGDLAGAWSPAVRAAIEAEANGRYAEARRWLLLAATLPEPPDAQRGYDLTLVRARVALRTEAGEPRMALVDAAERAARGAQQEQLVRILRAEYRLRAGEVRPALVAALRVASPNQEPEPHVAVRALLVATHARFLLGQFDEAGAQLERAMALLKEHPEPRLEVQAANWYSELLFRRNDLQRCRTLGMDAIRRASETGYVRGAAFAASRLSQVLRVLGRRREAEHQMRAAREAFVGSSDLVLGAETGLELATLRAERGDSAGARQLLDEVIRQIKGLSLDPMLGRAMRVALQIATVRADPTEAALALAGIDVASDPEAPAALVRWWRIRGDVDRAIGIEPPQAGTYGHVLWQVERARAALAGGVPDRARPFAAAALDDAARHGFAELQTYARLLLAVLDRATDAEWRKIVEEASASLLPDLYLGAIEMEARRLHASGEEAAANARWRALRARAEELGYRPGVEEATGWLTVDKG